MLIRASGPLNDDLSLLTLGASARYLIAPPDGKIALIDPGCSAHFEALLKRLSGMRIAPQQISFIVLTHLHADRVTAAALLKQLNPSIQIVGSSALQAELATASDRLAREDRELCDLLGCGHETLGTAPLLIDRVLQPGERLTLGENTFLQAVAAPGHTQVSAAFFLEPHRSLIADESIGYFRGKELPAPGADFSIAENIKTVENFLALDAVTLCLPHSGVLIGDLVPRHLAALRDVLQDLVVGAARARTDGITADEMRAQIARGLYSLQSNDPLLLRNLGQSCAAVSRQLVS